MGVWRNECVLDPPQFVFTEHDKSNPVWSDQRWSTQYEARSSRNSQRIPIEEGVKEMFQKQK